MYFLGILMVLIFAFSMSYYIELSFLFVLVCSVLSLLFLSLMIKNGIYLSIACKVMKVKTRELESEVADLNQSDFLEYIARQKDLPLKEGKKVYGFNYLVDQLIFGKKYNKKTEAIKIYEKRFGEKYILTV